MEPLIEEFATRINTFLDMEDPDWMNKEEEVGRFSACLTALFQCLQGKFYDFIPKHADWSGALKTTREWTEEYLNYLPY